MTFAGLLGLLAVGTVQADIAVVVNPKSLVSSLSANQVGEAYIGRVGRYHLVNLAESSPLRAGFFSKTTHKDAVQMKAVWAKLTFTGKALPPAEAAGAAEVKKIVAADEKALGYIDKKDVDDWVKIVLLLP